MSISYGGALVVGCLGNAFNDEDFLDDLLDDEPDGIRGFAPWYDAERRSCIIGISIAEDQEIDLVALAPEIEKAKALFTKNTLLPASLYVTVSAA